MSTAKRSPSFSHARRFRSRKKRLEHSLGVNLDPDAELFSIINEDLEYFDKIPALFEKFLRLTCLRVLSGA